MQDLKGLGQWPKMMTNGARLNGGLPGLPTLILGAGCAARTLARDLRRSPDHGLHPVGCLDDNLSARPILGLPILGRLTDLRRVVTEWGIEAVVIAIPSLPATRVRALATEAAATGVVVRYLPSFLAAAEAVAHASDMRALQLGADANDDRVPFAKTEITVEAQQAALRVLASGWVTTGPETVVFEEEFATWVGAPEAVAVSSCTAAIELALLALRLPANAPVLTPTVTFCSAVHAIVHAGLRPVLVDVDEDTLTVSPEGVAAAAAKSGAAAMVVQHMAGYPIDVKRLAEAAGLTPDLVIEDAAHGLGATLGGRPVGSLSRAACFSFYATKNLPIGEGGAVTTADPEVAATVRRMRLNGMSRDAWKRYGPGGSWRYSIEEPGLKANFTDVQAAIGRGQLRALSGWQRRRAALAASYDTLLATIPGVTLPPRPAADRHAWHLYIVRIGPEFGMSRDEAVGALAERGIGTSVHFIPIHQQPYFRRLLGADVCDSLPVADRVFPELLSLPLHPGLNDRQIERVCTVLADVANPISVSRPMAAARAS